MNTKMQNINPNVFLGMTNIANEYPDLFKNDNELNLLGDRVIREYDVDERSRAEWRTLAEKGTEFARMVIAKKSDPWEGSANIVYPMITQSAIQFNSRAYPNIVKGYDIVKGKVIGKDEDGSKADRALRIGRHMSYQLKEETPEWESETDKMLIHLAIVGTTFKKTYYDPTPKKNYSEFCTALDVCVHMKTKSLERAPRITHIYTLYPNEIEEKIRSGVFLEFEYFQSPSEEFDPDDYDAPHVFLEQHRWLDLDGDNYKEPYIVTVHKDTHKVVRVVARFESKGIITNGNKIIKIEPLHYFTKFTFIPSMDNSFYDIGFGILLEPLNETANTTINQLLDAGTRENTGGGFISSKLRIGEGTKGVVRYKPGEYQVINADGDDIRKSVFEFQNKGASRTLMVLLEFIVSTSEKLGNITDVLTGEQPGQNVPATTIVALIEQGLKVFTAVYKRVHRSLTEEYRKLFKLNAKYLDDEVYFNIADDQMAIAREDYDITSCDVIPVSDPDEVSEVLALAKAEALKELIGAGLNDMEIFRMYLQALQIENIDKIIPSQEQIAAQQQPDPQAMIEAQKLDIEERKLQIETMKAELEKEKLDIEREKTLAEIKKIKAEAIKALADAESKEVGDQFNQYKQQMESLIANLDNRIASMEQPAVPTETNIPEVPQGQMVFNEEV